MLLNNWFLMKKIFTITAILLVSLANFAQQSTKIQKNQRRLSANERLLTINGIPTNDYLNNPRVDTYAKKFFKGEIAIANDSITYSILDNAIICDDDIRQFYFYLFNKIIEKSDETMIEGVSIRCLKFIEMYPCDFFKFLNQPDFEVNIVKWTTFVGSRLSGGNKYALFKGKYDSYIKTNCNEVYDLWKSFCTEVRMCLVR